MIELVQMKFNVSSSSVKKGVSTIIKIGLLPHKDNGEIMSKTFRRLEFI